MFRYILHPAPRPVLVPLVLAIVLGVGAPAGVLRLVLSSGAVSRSTELAADAPDARVPLAPELARR